MENTKEKPEFRLVNTGDKVFFETKTESGWEFAGRPIFNQKKN